MSKSTIKSVIINSIRQVSASLTLHLAKKRAFNMKILILFIISANLYASSFDHNHSVYSIVLKNIVVQKQYTTQVDYKKLKKDPSLLNEYLNEISKVTKKEFDSFKKNQKLSFLINAYNAFTLKLIIDHYPIKSIKDIGSFFSSPWSKDFFTLFGKETDLDTIEHDMIRKWFDEPRIHFAVNCASIGCPALQTRPFLSGNLEKQLEESTKQFLSDPSRNRYKDGILEISPIFKWYGKDFKSYVEFILKEMPNLPPDIDPKKVKIEFLNYDWGLNDLNH